MSSMDIKPQPNIEGGEYKDWENEAKGGTDYDLKDMERVGKKQELKVCSALCLHWTGQWLTSNSLAETLRSHSYRRLRITIGRGLAVHVDVRTLSTFHD